MRRTELEVAEMERLRFSVVATRMRIRNENIGGRDSTCSMSWRESLGDRAEMVWTLGVFAVEVDEKKKKPKMT